MIHERNLQIFIGMTIGVPLDLKVSFGFMIKGLALMLELATIIDKRNGKYARKEEGKIF